MTKKEGCVKGRLEVCRELGGAHVGIGRWGSELSIRELMEVNMIVWVPAMETEAGLAAVGGGAEEVDWDVVSGDKAGEVEELVEMAL